MAETRHNEPDTECQERTQDKPQPQRHGLMVDGQGFVFVDGVKVARVVRREGAELCLQFCDRDRRRAARRGTRYPEVGVGELVRAVRELARVVGEG